MLSLRRNSLPIEDGASLSEIHHGRRDGAIVRTLSGRPEWFNEQIVPQLSGYPGAGCWEWAGTLVNGRDPQARLPRGAYGPRNAGVSARRVVWLALVGPIPAGHVLHPACGNARCCNAAHCAAESIAALCRRPEVGGRSPWSRNARKTHCSRGHELTPANTIPYAARTGVRACHECLRERNELVRTAVRLLGLRWRDYAAEHGLSRAEATRVINEHKTQDDTNTTN